ncbi:chromosome partitioning protein ParA [Robbsia andropogonis]|uniref:Chromosome partitioning protein ParA n=1 Tax=Robbsia andropogonis TaxID=28092 RepID=A0A0F5JV81_9BURK|nr:chromosome partitioning protein ParA [Robbsia andropogonis]KKB61560.1 chromosome partitioning protein ParA [Robbsia andropogonis]
MDFATARVSGSGNNLHVSHGDDSGLYVEFEMRPVHQEFASEEAGRPIYKDVPHIHIMFPGDRTKEVVRPVRTEQHGNEPSDIQRFPRQWEAFKNQQEQVQDGTPIQEWPPISRGEALNLKGMKIHTVEALAALSDGNCSFLGGRELREKAKVWLSSASSNKESMRLKKENDNLRADLEAMKQQIKDLAATKETA